jgi:serine/threonine protein kinase
MCLNTREEAQVVEDKGVVAVGTVQLEDVKVEVVDDVDLRETNLTHFHSYTVSVFDTLCRSDFTMVRKLSQGINGDIFLYRWRRPQDYERVAVKKLRNNRVREAPGLETNERAIHLSKSWKTRSPEDALAEIGVLTHLSKQEDVPKYVLKMHGVFSDLENNLTWLVTEFAEGGELFNVACSGASPSKVQAYMWQLLQAVEYLHRQNIGHRDISLENVLLKDGNCKLMDFGMAVQSRAASGTPLRYFRKVGKQFYRGPECYVPEQKSVDVTAPSDAAPGDVVFLETSGLLCEVRLPANARPKERCTADVWGYAAEPADTFALGVCMFILAFQCPPWEIASLSNQFFSHVNKDRENGLESLLNMWGKSCLCPQAMLLLKSLLQIDPANRKSASHCLQTPWLADYKGSVDEATK